MQCLVHKTILSLGQPLNECFQLIRPLVEYNAEQFLLRTNNVFVFKALVPASRVKKIRNIVLTSENDEGENAVSNNVEDFVLFSITVQYVSYLFHYPYKSITCLYPQRHFNIKVCNQD